MAHLSRAFGREMAATANIVFSPYSYLINGKFRGGLKTLKWTNAVLIFDEAHNLEVRHDRRCRLCRLCRQMTPTIGCASACRKQCCTGHPLCAQEVCREAASFDLKAEDLAACIEMLHVAAEIAASKRDQVQPGDQENAAQQLRLVQMVPAMVCCIGEPHKRLLVVAEQGARTQVDRKGIWAYN